MQVTVCNITDAPEVYVYLYINKEKKNVKRKGDRELDRKPR